MNYRIFIISRLTITLFVMLLCITPQAAEFAHIDLNPGGFYNSGLPLEYGETGTWHLHADTSPGQANWTIAQSSYSLNPDVTVWTTLASVPKTTPHSYQAMICPTTSEGNLSALVDGVLHKPPSTGKGKGTSPPLDLSFTANLSAIKVDLVIHNGLRELSEDEMPVLISGGQEISEEDEDKIGAFTVANLNDTDGNGEPDFDNGEGEEGEVKARGENPKGRDELDLMELIIKKPDPDSGGNVKLTVKSGNVKLWHQSTKKDPFPLTNGAVDISTMNLPMTIWVEGVSPSEMLRDIEIELEYKGITDNVKATAVWAKMTRFRNNSADDPQIVKTITANAAMGQPKITVDDATGLQAGMHLILYSYALIPKEYDATISRVNGNEITLNADLEAELAVDDEIREGLSPLFNSGVGIQDFRNRGGKLGSSHVDPVTNNGMEMEFTLFPAGIGKEKTLVWDVTRQAEGQVWLKKDGVTTPKDSISWQEKKVEEPTDDIANGDEDNSPTEDKIYVWDTIGDTDNFTGGNDRFVSNLNAREFLRVRIGKSFTVPANGKIEGSQCSNFVKWRSRLDAIQDPMYASNWKRNEAGTNEIVLIPANEEHGELGPAP